MLVTILRIVTFAAPCLSVLFAHNFVGVGALRT